MKTEHFMNNLNFKTFNKSSPNKIEIHPKRKQKSMHRKTNSQFFGFEDLQLLNLDTQSSHRPFSAAHLGDNNNTKIPSNNNVNIFIQNINVESTPPNDEEQLNNSVIIKDNNITSDHNVVDNNSNKSIGMTKSFIPLVNTLKYVREKEENATESYLLALGLEKEEKNKDYNVGSIIEEEKSDLLISESDFSSKKKILAKYGTSPMNNNTNNIQQKHFDGVNINLNRSKFEQMFKSNSNKNTITSNKVIFSGHVSIKEQYNTNNNKINLTLNEMIKRKEEKDKNYRNQLTNNKMCLLNTFYTLTNANHTGNQNHSNDNTNTTNNNVSSKHSHTKDEHKPNLQQITLSHPKKQSKTNKSSNSTTISFNDHNNTNSVKNTKKIRRTLSQNINSIYNTNNNHHHYYSNRSSYNKQNKEPETTRQINEAILKNNINIKIHHSKSKSKDKAIISFPNTNDISSTHNIDSITLRQKLIASHNKNKTVDLLALNEELTSVNTIPLKNLHYHIKKKTIADLTQITSDNKEHVPVTKHKNFANALTLIQSQRNSKCSIHNNSNINIPNNNNSNNNSNSHCISNTNNNTSANTNSNTRTYTRSNSRSSRTKDNKNDNNSNNACCFKKTKSQGYLNHVVPVVNNGNYFQTANTLKNKLLYSKTYEKKDVIDKILSSTSNGYYLIMCYNNNKKQNERDTHGVESEFMFLGLFKYYNTKERFIKIYGNEKCQNIIQLKQLTTPLIDVFDIYVVDTKNTMFYIQSKYAFNDKSYVILKTKAHKK